MSRPPTLAAPPLARPWASRGVLVAPAPSSTSTSASSMLDPRLSIRASLALAHANARYWSSVAPLVRAQLAHWHRRAAAISDPGLRALALAKLSREGFNAEVAATLATLAPRPHRRRVVKAIVALEIVFDYLDGLTESPVACMSGDGERLFCAFSDAVSPALQREGDYYRHHPRRDESGYLEELVATVRFALASLPATAKLAALLRAAAQRSSEAQLRIHALSQSGTAELERWARVEAVGSSLDWREYLAGAASSVLSVHALIAAAADPRTTYAQALATDRAYLAISALPTVLDSLIDYEADVAAGAPGYLQLYDSRDLLQRRLAGVIRDALQRAGEAPNGAHHVMTIVGIVAYYTSAPTAAGEFARAVAEQTRASLRPLITPTLAVMRLWRGAKRLRAGVSQPATDTKERR